MKKIYKYWTVQSIDLERFDKEINANLEIGWRILDSGYSVIKSQKGQKYSQVLLWQGEEEEYSNYKFQNNFKQLNRYVKQ